ncbi:family 10 glycosylhydrolase [Paenibacillus sanfengchensis]|uniref:family 10 glycosylhydrolase n=1 Tax=Paenibacillus sanfengchensis TaxID=3119819 RepID=UPI002FE2C9BF
MKFFRVWLLALLVFVLVWPASGTGQVQAALDRDIQIMMDGEILPSDSAPYVKPIVNVTMVPLRVISEEMGAGIDWSSATRSATIEKDGSTLVLKMGNKTAEVNGTNVPLEVSVESRNSRTMVPLRFVGEQLGLTVDWDPTSRIITLTSPAGGTEKPPEASPPTEPQQPDIPAQNDELRGAWISTVSNLDWPSKASYGKADAQKAEYTKLLDELQETGINAVFVQVRPSADALYRSELVPWSGFLTGTVGKDPGYDPLQFLIEETHRRGMQFHAWFNPFRASTGSDVSKLPANHVAKQHPEWIVKFDGKLYINPGIPEARAHIVDAIMEVVNQYDIDGVHLDDYFYPSGETAKVKFNDDNTFKSYNANNIGDKGDWRRDNINDLVRELDTRIHAVKPSVSFGISPFGVWRNKATDPTGSDTRAGITAYDSTYADVRTWIREGWIDYVVPQIYWSMTRKEARYDIIAKWWAGEVRGTGVKLYVGHAPYKIGTPEIGWNTAQEIIDQLDYNRTVPEISGSIFFSAKDLLKNPLGLISLLQTYYGNK